MSDSFLVSEEQPWANRSGRSPKMSEWGNRAFFWANRSFANFFAKNEQFAQKTDERIPSPAKNSSELSSSASDAESWLVKCPENILHREQGPSQLCRTIIKGLLQYFVLGKNEWDMPAPSQNAWSRSVPFSRVEWFITCFDVHISVNQVYF